MRLTTRGIVVLLALGFLVGFFTWQWVWAATVEPGPGLGPSQSITCTEDMACWDCTTMGNGRCGP